MKDDMWFFGAVGGAGHHLWMPGPPPERRPKSIGSYTRIGQGLRWDKLDSSALVLPFPDIPGNGALTWAPSGGVTVLAWWDRHVDSRPGSNAQVIMTGKRALLEILAAYEKRFPTLVELGIFPNLGCILA